MDRLPYEVWQHICYLSDTKTLKVLRFVHTVLNDLAARALFQTVYVAALKYSFQNLSRIATHPNLRFYVRKIMFLDQVLNDSCRDYGHWLRYVDLRALSDSSVKLDDSIRKWLRDSYRSSPNGPFEVDIGASVDLGSGQAVMVSEEILANNYVKYVELCFEQTHLFPEDEHELKEVDRNAERGAILKPLHCSAVDYITYAVQKLANLRALETFEEVKHMERTYWTTWDSGDKPKRFLSRLQRETLLKKPFQKDDMLHYISQTLVSSQPTMALLKALCPLLRRPSLNLAVPKLDLVISALPWSFWMSGLWASDSAAVLTVLNRLRSLEIHFCIDETRGPKPLTNQMTEFMKGLKDVERLTLTFNFSENGFLGVRRPGLPFLDISDTFQRLTFERLSSLKIGSCSFNEEVLVAFMQRHSRQLKRLEIQKVKLIGDFCSWRSTIQRIAPIMSLEVAHLQCLLDDEISTIKDVANLEAIVDQYSKKASLYLKLNGSCEYPSLIDLASKFRSTRRIKGKGAKSVRSSGL